MNTQKETHRNIYNNSCQGDIYLCPFNPNPFVDVINASDTSMFMCGMHTWRGIYKSVQVYTLISHTMTYVGHAYMYTCVCWSGK